MDVHMNKAILNTKAAPSQAFSAALIVQKRSSFVHLQIESHFLHIIFEIRYKKFDKQKLLELARKNRGADNHHLAYHTL